MKLLYKKNEAMTNILIAIYMYLPTLLSLIIYFVPSLSFMILLIFEIVIIGLIVYINGGLVKRNLLAFMVVFLLIFADVILRMNGQSFNYFYYCMAFGLTSIIVFSYVYDVKKFLYYFGKTSFIVFIIFSWMPFTSFQVYGDYMAFGFNVVLPVFCGLLFFIKYSNSKPLRIITIIMLILCLVETVVFANKGALIGELIFLIIYSLINARTYKGRILNIMFAITIVIIIFNLESILLFLNNSLASFGVRSYSIYSLNNALSSGDFNIITSGRSDIWESGLKYWSNNFWIGGGTGSLENSINSYAHNIFVDFGAQYGLIGIIAFSIILCRGLFVFFNNLKTNKSISELYLLYLCNGFIVLLSSMRPFQNRWFWIFMFICVTYSVKDKKGSYCYNESINLFV